MRASAEMECGDLIVALVGEDKGRGSGLIGNFVHCCCVYAGEPQVRLVLAKIIARRRDNLRLLSQECERIRDVARSAPEFYRELFYSKTQIDGVRLVGKNMLRKKPWIIHDAIVCDGAGDDYLGHVESIPHCGTSLARELDNTLHNVIVSGSIAYDRI